MALYNKYKHARQKYKIDLRNYDFKFEKFEYFNIERLLHERNLNFVWLLNKPTHYDGPLVGSHILGTNQKETHDKILDIIEEVYTNLITEKLLSE